jgi:hypothetical protein
MLYILPIGALLLVASVSAALAGPFGLEMGTQVSKEVMERDESKFTFTTVPNPHPLFEVYTGWQNAEFGLCRVLAVSEEFDNDRYGSKVRDAFDRVQSALTEKYGSGRKIEFLKPDALWDEPNDWVMSLKQSERTHASVWEDVVIENESYDLIQLWVSGISSSNSVLIIEYRMKDFSPCGENIENEHDDSF